MNRLSILSILLLTILGWNACTPKPDLKGLDLKSFLEDPGGCKGERAKTVDWLVKNKFNFQGTSSNDLADILGSPDVQQLADRNQEYYIYFLESGNHCKNKKTKSEAYCIAFRFSAIGLVTEITFQNGLP